MIDNRLLIKIRQATGMGVMDIKKALQDANGDEKKAVEFLRAKGEVVMAKRNDKETTQGVVDVYGHNGRIGVIVEVNCETDFVARNDEFKAFAHDLALQISSMEPKDVADLMQQDFIKDSSRKMADILNDLAAKMGEKIVVKRFERFALGE